MRKNFVTWNTIKNEHGSGSWSFNPDGRVVTVVTANGKKATQLGGLPLECLINILMRELSADCPGCTE